ncbi:calcium-binding protein, partial [Dyella sp. EPa41]|uniref:calcium-binding protein n=1 Tax=Dyella sp. EPa41 TaxID=1561194 RepID=UPI0027145FF1
GNDIMLGGTGDDVLDAGGGSNRLEGGAGNDTLKVATSGDDNVFIGGIGDDVLYGSYNSDTYVFNLGDGKDTIVETSAYSGAVDVLAFGEGIRASDIVVTKRGADLVFVHASGQDEVTVKDWFTGTTSSGYESSDHLIEQVTFADGTVWTLDDLRNQGHVSQGTSGSDTLNGWSGNDIMLGGDGDDMLDGCSGTNRLEGGAGNDTLKVAYNATNNVFIGGAGDDVLYGSYNSDTYVFNLGDGKDIIAETSAYSGAVDVLAFGEGIQASDITAIKRGVDLVFVHRNGEDEITVKDWFTSTSTGASEVGGHLVEQVTFADGTVWTVDAMRQQGYLSQGTAGNATLNGWSGNDLLRGGDGDDVLDAGAGSNRLEGGAGNDTLKVTYYATDNVLVGGTGDDLLYGSYYSDTYVFNLGDGKDTIVESASYSDATDVLCFGEAISADQLWFRRVGTDLEISVIGTRDSTTIRNWYSGEAYQVEQFKTADGGTLLSGQVDTLVSAMATFAPPAADQSYLPPDYAGSLSPLIAANWH